MRFAISLQAQGASNIQQGGPDCRNSSAGVSWSVSTASTVTGDHLAAAWNWVRVAAEYADPRSWSRRFAHARRETKNQTIQFMLVCAAVGTNALSGSNNKTAAIRTGSPLLRLPGLMTTVMAVSLDSSNQPG
jgi:hypothetical protein